MLVHIRVHPDFTNGEIKYAPVHCGSARGNDRMYYDIYTLDKIVDEVRCMDCVRALKELVLTEFALSEFFGESKLSYWQVVLASGTGKSGER